jgi:hypothetical protein
MKKIITALLILICAACYGQDKDTIVLKTGAKIICTLLEMDKKSIVYGQTIEGIYSKSTIPIETILRYVSFFESKEINNTDPINFQIVELNRKINTITDNSYYAGECLKTASYCWYAGVGLTLLGAGLSSIGLYTESTYISSGTHPNQITTSQDNPSTIYYVLGGICGVGALVCYINIPINWHKAGKYLQKR